MQAWKYFTTKGVDELLGLSLVTLRRKLDKVGCDKKSQEFVEKLDAAEKEAKVIGEKWVKRVEANPLRFYAGYEYSHWDLLGNMGHRFWFKPATEPDFSI